MIPSPPVFRWFLYAAAVCACLGWFAHQSDSVGAFLFIGASLLAFGPISATTQRGMLLAMVSELAKRQAEEEFRKNWKGGR